MSQNFQKIQRSGRKKRKIRKKNRKNLKTTENFKTTGKDLKITREQFIALRKAITFLAENDRDRASRRNRKGFSKRHTKIGHQLAEKTVWDKKDVNIAFELALFYKRQLPSDLKRIIFKKDSDEPSSGYRSKKNKKVCSE